MSKPEACDAALLRAMVNDTETREAVEDMMGAQMRFNEDVMEEMNWTSMDAGIPSPSRMNAQAITEWAGGKAELAWESFKQMRAALMLSNPLTHIKNVTATGGQAAIVRPLEESIGILLSRLKPGHESRSWKEMYYYAAGAVRGGQDSVMMLKHLGELFKDNKVLQMEEFRTALKDAGYGEQLAHGKPDLVINRKTPRPDANASMAEKGGYYLFNTAFGSQFSLLQGADTFFKMISHRAKVQQKLAREANRFGESMDEYVSENWQRMSDDVKAGRVSDDLADIQQAGFTQAAEDTFTQTPQTKLGQLMSGNFETTTGWQKAVSEGMQVVAPFRSIYVNLMRQTISRRLLPFFDPKSRQAFMGKLGKEEQEMAMARFAGAWTLVGGTLALIDQTGLKLHGPDELDPQVREMQFQMHGKVGNTIQMGDQYFPTDALPPSIAIPLTYWAAATKGINEMNYRYVDPEDKQEAFMRAMGPLMNAVTDGPWVKEYMDFLARTNTYIQYGNPGGLGNYIASIGASPLKAPNWIKDLMGVDPSVKTTDGLVDKIRTDFLMQSEAYGLRRNLFGRAIQPLERIGSQSHYVWHGGDDDVMSFLGAAGYDKVHPTNITMNVKGDGNANNRIDDSIDMNSKERDRFEYYVGQSRINGMTMQEEMRQFMSYPGVYNQETGELLIHESKVQAQLLKIVSKRRNMARQLIKYHPQFKIRERQIERFHRAAQAQGMSKGESDQLRQQQLTELNQARMQLQGQF